MDNENRFDAFSRDERASLAAALDARRDNLARAADPGNPWQEPSAVAERASLADLARELAAVDEAAADSLLDDLLSL